METNGYCAVYEGGQGEIVEKKSRFIATVLPIETEEEALEFIAKMKKKYWDARHNCYAYVIGERQELQRCSDDGEPNGTAALICLLFFNHFRKASPSLPSSSVIGL